MIIPELNCAWDFRSDNPRGSPASGGSPRHFFYREMPMIPIDARTLTRYQKDRILERDDYCCLYCFGKAEEVDHIIPWSFTHDNSDRNLVSACWLCNRIASDKVFKTFSRKRDYVVNKRYWFQKSKIIPLWTKEELAGIGRTLRTHVESRALICEDEKERQRVKHILMQDGWRVVAKEILFATRK
jgi:hypothetical protein